MLLHIITVVKEKKMQPQASRELNTVFTLKTTLLSWSSYLVSVQFTQTHVHHVCDAIQPSHPLSSPFPPAPNPSQHLSLFHWVNSAWHSQSTEVSALASFLPKNSQDWSPSEWNGWISLQSKGFSRVFSNTTVQMHQFFGAQLSSQSNSHIHTWPLEKP